MTENEDKSFCFEPGRLKHKCLYPTADQPNNNHVIKNQWSSKRTHNLIDPQIDSQLYSLYMFRDMLQVPEPSYSRGPQLSIMTYNVLYTLGKSKEWILKGFFPHRLRERVILAEIGRYNPDIVCLQEVPVSDPDNSWWQEQLFRLGYESNFAYVGPQDHGIGICFKHDLFVEICHDYSNLDPKSGSDKENTPKENLSKSNRAVLFLCLGFTEKFLQGHVQPSRQGIIIGNTHLAVTRASRYDKMSQARTLINLTRKFGKHVRAQTRASHDFYSFLAGDFNSREFDPAHSTGSLPCPSREQYREHSAKVSYDQFIEERNRLLTWQDYIYSRLMSLYAIGYDVADPDTDAEQLWFFIDYIFVVQQNSVFRRPKSKALQALAQDSSVRLLSLLRVPTKSEVGKSRLSQPEAGVCASDHVCLMAEMELL